MILTRSNIALVNDGAWKWANTIHTIMLREVRCRFVGDPLGYAWTFIVPLLWIATIMAFFGFLGKAPTIPVNTPTFIATGIVPYVLFRYTITSMARVAGTHKHLVHFAAVRLSDLLFAAALLELLNALVIFALAWFLISVTVGTSPIDDYLQTFQGILLTAAVGASFGRFATIIGLVSETARRIVPVVLRPTFWISGVFFAASDLPSKLVPYFYWNPILHAVEITRSGVFLDYQSEFADVTIPLAFSIFFLLFSHMLQGAFGRTNEGMEML